VTEVFIDYGKVAQAGGEDAELVGDADVVAVAAQTVRDDALAHLAVDERLDHAVLQRHLADPVVGFDGHGDSWLIGKWVDW